MGAILISATVVSRIVGDTTNTVSNLANRHIIKPANETYRNRKKRRLYDFENVVEIYALLTLSQVGIYYETAKQVYQRDGCFRFPFVDIQLDISEIRKHVTERWHEEVTHAGV